MGSDSSHPYPINSPGVSWRALQSDNPSGLGAAWRELETAAAGEAGSPPSDSVEQYTALLKKGGERAANSIAGFNAAGELIARGWVIPGKHLKNEYRVFLDGLIHPAYQGQGLGAVLLDWMVARGIQLLEALPGDRGKTLRHDFYARPQAAVGLLEGRGFSFFFAEDEMRRSLSEPLPPAVLEPGLEIVSWTPKLPGAFYAVYNAAFRTRPGFPHWPESVWVDAFTNNPEFSAEHTLLLQNAEGGVGYAILDIDLESGEGWISQMGVAPQWRRRGFGKFILVEVMRRLRAAGFKTAGLDVNLNNPEAANLYMKLGFKPCRRYTSYRKVIVAVGDH